jgi:prolipoprotein diacylglyceryltransferase
VFASPGAIAFQLGPIALRFFTEALRIDSLMLGSFRVAQLVSIVLLFGAGLGLLAITWKHAK